MSVSDIPMVSCDWAGSIGYTAFMANLNPGLSLEGTLQAIIHMQPSFAATFAWVLMFFVFLTTVLQAMQVGLATNRLQASFQDVAYGFAVFSLLLPIATIAFVVTILIFLFLYKLVVTVVN